MENKWKFFQLPYRNVYIQILSAYILKEKYIKKSESDHSSSTNNSDKEQFLENVLSTSPPSATIFLKCRQTHSLYDPKTYLQEGKELLTYLESYSLDPFSSLIGNKPSESIIKSAFINDSLHGPLSIGEIVIGISVHDASEDVITSKRTSTVKHLQYKAKKKLSKSESTFSSKFLKSAITNSDYLYVRYLHSNDDITIQAQTSVEDNRTKRFASFFRLPTSIASEIAGTTPENLRQFVENCSDKLFKVFFPSSQSEISRSFLTIIVFSKFLLKCRANSWNIWKTW